MGPGDQVTGHPYPAFPPSAWSVFYREAEEPSRILAQAAGTRDRAITGDSHLSQPLVVPNGENWSEMWVQGSHSSPPRPFLQL